MPSFGSNSRDRRDTLHPVLQRLCDRVVAYTDITILVGHRNRVDQAQAFRQGRSTKQFPDSKHNTTPSVAVDASPFPIPDGWGELDAASAKGRDLEWKERVKFYQMAAVFRHEWERMQHEDPVAALYRLRWGGDWDRDGDYRDNTFDDLVHFEIIRQ